MKLVSMGKEAIERGKPCLRDGGGGGGGSFLEQGKGKGGFFLEEEYPMGEKLHRSLKR